LWLRVSIPQDHVISPISTTSRWQAGSWCMSKNGSGKTVRKPAKAKVTKVNVRTVAAKAPASKGGQLLDLERYVPAFITFIANKLSRNATALYQKRFGVNVTEWRIMSLLAIEPGIPASRICHVIGFDKGPVSRTLAMLEERGLVAINADPDDARTHSITLTTKGRTTHDAVIVTALERERKLLSCLDESEREVLIDLLRRIHGNLGAVTG
jgi:DNA-binding MarR family transcriptional regulator